MTQRSSIAALTLGSNAVSPAIAVAGSPWDIAFGGDAKGYVTLFNSASVAHFTPGSPTLTALTMPVVSTGAASAIAQTTAKDRRDLGIADEPLQEQVPAVGPHDRGP